METIDSNEKNIMVSIICLAYNHHTYIKDALDGVLNQKTNFKYEMIIHDDCSSDGTKEIIQEYQKLYPEIIKPIYQTENQYSKGIDIEKTYIRPKCKGKYIAYCEGDDYWCDNNKLQRQVDFLENNNDYSVCGHRHYVLNCRTGEKSVSNSIAENHTVDLRVISDWEGAQFHTSSYVYRKEFALVPEEMRMKNVGNYPLLVWLAINGKAYQFADVMSVYRIYTAGSWSQSKTKGDILKKRIDGLEDSIRMISSADRLSEYKYHSIFNETYGKYYAELCCLKGDLNKCMNEYKKFFKSFSIKKRISLLIASKTPKLWNKMKNKGF